MSGAGLVDLLAKWRETHDERAKAGALVRAKLELLQAELAEIEIPYDETLAELEQQIRPLAEELGRTYQGDGVEVRYRVGARRVTYDWRRVDSLLGVLRDVLPETAVTLEGARKETVGKPSVRVVRVD
jgi:hypothetical protein